MSPVVRDRTRTAMLHRGFVLVTAAAALVYVALAIATIWRTADVGFRIQVGREVVFARAGGPLHVGDRIEGIDGRPLRTTVEYARWRASVRAGDAAVVTIREAHGTRRDVAITATEAPVPVLALVTAGFAVLLLGFALWMRLRSGDDGTARRFWATTVPFPFIYVGALAAPHALADPILIGGLAVALGLAPVWLRDFFASFPMPLRPPSRRGRIVVAGAGGVAAVATVAAIVYARFVDETDLSVRAAVAGLLGMGLANVIVAAIGLRRQWRHARVADATERAQLKWLLGGFGLVVVHTAVIAPGAFSDPAWFTAGGYVPLVCGAAIFWFGASTLAVLRVRLPTIDAVVPSSVLYSAAARGSVAAAALAVIAAGTIAHRLAPDATAVAAAATAIAGAVLFGPVRARIQDWLDTWSGRDRRHYLAEVHGMMSQLLPLRDSTALARVALEKVVAAVSASGGAAYLPTDGGTSGFERVHACGHGEYPAALASAAAPAAPENLACRVERAGTIEALLVLGPRRGGDPYRDEDRDLLAAVAGSLAAAFEAARSSMSVEDLDARLAERERELTERERELGELRRRAAPHELVSAAVDAPAEDPPALVGDSEVAATLREHVTRMAASSASVLIGGETGAGKGIVARELHRRSPRASGPLVHVDCAAIPAGLFESELFGHERGAFTGAERSRKGVLELASGGTVFLDEIGELPLALQPKLLRALQERTVLPLGATRSRTVDVRVIAATNRDLDAMVRAGTFREDLYFRLRVLELEVSPLRARRADIGAIAVSLLPRIAQRNRVAGLGLTPDAIATLERHDWPGNIRELENALERAIVLGGVSMISAAELVLTARVTMAAADARPLVEAAGHREYLDAVERERLVAALAEANGNRALAARRLGLPRTTLVNKLRRYRITS